MSLRELLLVGAFLYPPRDDIAPVKGRGQCFRRLRPAGRIGVGGEGMPTGLCAVAAGPGRDCASMNPKGGASWVTLPIIQAEYCLGLVLCRYCALGMHSSDQQVDDQRPPFFSANGCEGRHGALRPLHELRDFRWQVR